MALLLNTVAKQRLVQQLDDIYNTSSPIYLYSNSIAQPGGTNNFLRGTYSAALLVGPITGWDIISDDTALVFDLLPTPTAATASGTLTWCAIRNSTTTSASETIIGPITLNGGNGLVEIVNGGEGGGSGLSVNVGDIISITKFRLEW